MRNKDINLKKCSILLILAIFLSITASKSSIAAEIFNKENNGLVTELALSVFADENNVWFASGKAGFMSYDKASGEFKTYSNKTNYDLLGDVYSVVTAFGKTWIGTDEGINVLDEGGKLSAITEIEVPSIDKPGTISKPGLRMARRMWVKGGYLWVGAYSVHGGLFRYDGKDWEEIRFGKSKFNYVSDIEIVADDIWYATSGFGIYIYNEPSKRWKIINSGSKDIAVLPNDTLVGLVFVDGNVWAGTMAGVCEVRRDGDEFEVIVHDDKTTEGALDSSSVTTITATESGDIIVGTTSGVSMYSTSMWERLQIKDITGKDIDFKKVYGLGSDADTIWIGSNKGIIKEDI